MPTEFPFVEARLFDMQAMYRYQLAVWLKLEIVRKEESHRMRSVTISGENDWSNRKYLGKIMRLCVNVQ